MNDLKPLLWAAGFGIVIIGVNVVLGHSLHLEGVARILNLCLVAASGWFLPPVWSLVPGVTAVAGDLTQVPTLNSLTFLLWAAFIGLPHLVSQSRARDRSWSGPQQSDRKLGSDSAPQQTVAAKKSDGWDQDISDQLMQLFTRHFQRAREQLQADNLLYFHVRDGEAQLGYLINEEGSIHREGSLSDQSGQGVGWVIRHEEELILKQRQIDWRNLQYHRHQVDLDRVQMTPIHHDGELIGVLVLEWVGSPDEENLNSLDSLVQEIERFMNVDRTLRDWSRSQNRYRLLEEILRVNPLEEDSFEGIIHRCRELIETYVPADDIHFYQTDGSSSSKVVNRREVLFRRCFDWLQKGHRTLFLDDVQNQSLGKNPLSRIAPPDVGSLMAGRVGEADEGARMIVLTHGESGFFTVRDRELLESILSYLQQMLRVGAILREEKQDRRREGILLEIVQDCLDRDSFDSRADCLVTRLREHLPLPAVSLHWKQKEQYRCVQYDGPGSPPASCSPDQALIRRLKDTDRGTTVALPERQHLTVMECPESLVAARIVPIRDGIDTLRGFLTFLFDSPSGLQDSFNDRIDMLTPILSDSLVQLDEKRQLQQRLRVDPLTQFLVFDEWRREVRGRIRRNEPSRVALWQLQVPGTEEIGERSGREGLRRWMRRLAETLDGRMSKSLMTRAYLGCFYGFCTEPSDRVQSRLEQLVVDLEDWSFPGGSWPKRPIAQVRSFSTPLSDLSQMLSGLDHTPTRKD